MRLAKLGQKGALIVQSLVLAFGFGAASIATLALPSGALAANACSPNLQNPLQSGADCSHANGTSNNLFATNGVFQTVANTLIFLVGAVSVVFLIIGGLRYVISNGDSKQVEAAKNTILYAIIGIVVAVIAFALVQFVINALAKT
jgi:Type IV secretion system pilin